MAITPGISSASPQTPTASFTTCFEIGVTPTTQVQGGIYAVRVGNAATATGPAYFRVNDCDDLIITLYAGQDSIIRCENLIRKLEAKGTVGIVYWNPCIC